MSNFICSECSKGFNSRNNLKQHVKKVHPLIECEVTSKGRDIHRCNLCEKSYTRFSALRRHEKSIHGIANYSSTCKCPLCEYRCHRRTLLHEHFRARHKLILEFEDWTFATYDEFSAWKEDMEQETNARFVKLSGDKKLSRYTTKYFYCHRSGNFVTKSKGHRQLKSQGSNKINGCCPARIKLIVASDGYFNVRYIKTHVGHENSVDYLPFTIAERDMLAAKIAAGVPFDTILGECHTSVSGNERLRLLKRKDLHNIEYQYKLNSHAENNENSKHDRLIAETLEANRVRHKASLCLNADVILLNKNGWNVCCTSAEENRKYTVQLTDKICSCKLVCEECKLCIHKYACTCPDSNEKGNMCEHIHLVCQILKNQPKSTSDCSGDELVISDQGDQLLQPENEVCVNETEVILEELSGNAIEIEGVEYTDSLFLEKENTKKEFGEIIDNITTTSSLDMVKNFLVSLKVAITSQYTNTSVSFIVFNNSEINR